MFPFTFISYHAHTFTPQIFKPGVLTIAVPSVFELASRWQEESMYQGRREIWAKFVECHDPVFFTRLSDYNCFFYSDQKINLLFFCTSSKVN